MIETPQTSQESTVVSPSPGSTEAISRSTTSLTSLAYTAAAQFQQQQQAIKDLKNVYRSETADINATFFQIGPLVYGGEVQDIKILEQKAVQSIEGARTDQNLLIDSGEGRADIQVTLIFSGLSHIKEGLLPLLALMKLSPISSVKNNIIEKSLSDSFTEGYVNTPNNTAIDKINKAFGRLAVIQELNEVINSSEANISADELFTKSNEYIKTLFDLAKVNGYNSKISNFDQWLKFVRQESYFSEANPGLDIPAAANLQGEPSRIQDRSLKNISKDKSGYVPVAILGIEITTNPELVDSLIVTLSLRRISIKNYLRDGLYYRDISNLPTPDARNAFWLNRAIDLYIERHYKDGQYILTFPKDSYSVKLNYFGEDVLLNLFSKENDIKGIAIGQKDKSPFSESVALQVTCSIKNKFSFHRLAGESYPTVQHTGMSSIDCTIGIRTNSDNKFKEIHTFKNAADFFLRSTDRADRYNGWNIDCLPLRLLNVKSNFVPGSDNKNQQSPVDTFFPINIVSSTVPEIPGCRDIVISFSATSTDFFSDFGFVLYTNGVNIDLLYQAYSILWDNAFENPKEDKGRYPWLIIMGQGDGNFERNSIINPSTIMAAFLEKQTYKNGQISSDSNYKNKGPNSILNFVKTNPLYSGSIIGEPDPGEDILEIISISDKLEAFFDQPLSNDITNILIEENINITPTDNAIYGRLLEASKKILYSDNRKDFYELLFSLAKEEQIKFTDRFKDHLFATIVKRAKVPVSDRLYDRQHIANAYDALERALITQAPILDQLNNTASNLADSLQKSKANDNVIVFSPDGSFNVSETRISAYPDYFYLTYEDLFDIPGVSRWETFALTYQDAGIINPSFKSYNPDATRPLTASSVQKAQRELITTPNSPISPSVFFYREQELEELRKNLDSTTRDWHSRLKELTVNIPYDIEFLIKEGSKTTGETGILDENGQVKNIKELASNKQLGLSSLIDKMNQNLIKQRKLSNDDIRKAAESLISKQFRRAKEELGFGSITDREFKQRVDNQNGLTPDQRLKYDSLINEGENTEFYVPIINTSHAGQEVAQYKKISGLIGSSVYKSIVKKAVADNKDFIEDTLKSSAANLDDGASLTNTAAPELFNSLLKASMSIPDNRHDLCKAFPTFRLYLIDYNQGDRLFIRDNFYGWNSILSIDITLDKNDAELAVIRIADPMHVLQGGVFEDRVGFNKGIIGNFSLPNSPDDLIEGNFFSRFQLKQGRAVQIRGGYSADPSNLDVLFNGRIAEVQFGDIVTIVAQGWKAELISKQVDFELTSVDNSSVKDLVVRTIQDADPAGFGSSLSQNDLDTLKNTTLDAIDGAWIRSAQNQFGTYGGESGYSGTKGLFGLHLLGGLGRGLDLRLKNIWAPDSEKGRFNYFADIESSGWEGRQWIVPMQPAWDVLQNATNYAWGYICQTVPYDTESTIFFGRPEQLYYYTKGDFLSNREYNKIKNKAAADFANTSINLLGKFIESNQYKGSIAARLLLSNSTYLTSTASSPASSLEAIGLFSESDGLKGFLAAFDMTGFIPTRQQIVFNPKELGFLGYGKYYIKRKAKDFDDYTSGSFNGSDIDPFIVTNLSNNFSSEYQKIQEFIGEKNGPYLLLQSFYGFSEQYINENFPPIETFTRSLTEPLTPERFAALKRRLLDSIQGSEAIENVNRIFGIPKISAKEASAHLTVLERYSTEQFADVRRTKEKVELDSGGSLGNIRGNETVSLVFEKDNDQAFSAILDSLAFFLNNYSAASLFREGTSQDDKISCTVFSINNFKRLRVKFSSQNPGKYTPKPALFKEIVDNAKIVLRQISTGVIKGIATFDDIYIGYSSRLALLDRPEANKPVSSDQIVDYIVYNIPLFRAYVYWLSEFLTQTNSDNPTVKQLTSALKDSISFVFPPSLNMKTFRDYHYVSNGVDIVSNNIAVTTREMYNTVVVRGQKSFSTSNDSWWKIRFFQGDYDDVDVTDVEWATWPNEKQSGHIGLQFNEMITLENKKIGIYSDINVDIGRPDQCAKVATNVLAKYIRPMYRNNLLLLGRAMKPWDNILLEDKYIDMHGPIEVERIVHHYSVNQGWVTNVVPHAVAEANPGASVIQRAILANQLDKIYNLVDYASWTITAITGLPILRAGLGFATAGARAGLTTGLKNGSIPFSRTITNRLNLSKFVATADESKIMLGDKLKILGSSLKDQTGPTLEAFLSTQTATYGVGEITRLWQLNAGLPDIQLPVTLSPLIFKGIPLEAGLNGRQMSYYSITSKLHWFLNDMIDGANEALLILSAQSTNARVSVDLLRTQAATPR